jgi:hypothetical protein
MTPFRTCNPWILTFLVFFCMFSHVEANMSIQKDQFLEYVDVELQGQLGNQLFQIATAYAYSLDNRIPLVIPELAYKTKWNIKYNAKRLFLDKINHCKLPNPLFNWSEPIFQYSPIPQVRQIKLSGYFQSEKYFKHRRAEILELFAPPSDLEQAIAREYPFLTSDVLLVGVQIRDYRHEFPDGSHHPTFGRSYYEQAIRFFPEGAVFVVSSNNLPFAKECMDGLSNHIIYLESGDYIKDFYALSLCHSFIISNSSYGWWSAWLSKSKNKKIIVPYLWFAPPYPDQMWRDLVFEDAIVIDVKQVTSN